MFIVHNIPLACYADFTVSSAKITNNDGLKHELISFNSVFIKIFVPCLFKGQLHYCSFVNVSLIRRIASTIFSSLVA
jgi:hypothetical protein